MIQIRKDEVDAMHLADVLHHLELICHIGKIKMEKYRQPICKILMEIIESEGERCNSFKHL